MRARALLSIFLAGGLACSQTATDPAPPTSATPQPASSVAPTASVSSAASASSAPPKPAPPPVVIADEGPYDIVDLHVDTPWKVHFKGRAIELKKGHATMEKLAKGSYAGIIYPIYIPDYADDHDPQIDTAAAIFDTIDKMVAAHDPLVPAYPKGKLTAVPDDRIAVFVTIEGAGAFAADITQIDAFIARGVRLIGPVHAHDNKLATSATGKGKYGLTKLGKDFCRRVYKKGALIDVSHMSDAAFADLVPIAAEFSAPIVATHSNARKLRGHPRNLTDEQLEKIATTGGVAGLNLHRTFVRKAKAKMSHVVDHVTHMVKVAGVDHVAIGTDYDGGSPVGALGDASEMQGLAKALIDAGLSDADVRKIFGRNALRVLTWQPR